MKICIVSPFAYGAMSGITTGHIGGVETQTSLLAKWLSTKTQHQISIITWNESSPDDEIIDGVRVIKLCKRSDGYPGLRFFHPRWTSLIDAMKKSDSDVYYQNCAEYVTGQVAIFCKQNKRKFVYSVASDPDCDPQLPTLRTFRERLLYRYGLKHAHMIITQTNYQHNLLKSGFGLDSLVLPMPCVDPDPGFSHACHMKDGKFRVLWVGRIARVKRAEVLLDIAAEAKDVIFEIAGGEDQEKEYTAEILKRAKGMENVILHGKLNRQQLNERYSKASAFCNTSIYEGFPNTFLEAWSHGLPVISTINPDNLISDNKLGINSTSTQDFVDAINLLRNNKSHWQELSDNARNYYLEYHSMDNAMRRFLKVFESV